MLEGPDLLQRVARALLDANFPPSLHEEIASQVGLDLASNEQTGSGGADAPRRRSPAFRDEVLMAEFANFTDSELATALRKTTRLARPWKDFYAAVKDERKLPRPDIENAGKRLRNSQELWIDPTRCDRVPLS